MTSVVSKWYTFSKMDIRDTSLSVRFGQRFKSFDSAIRSGQYGFFGPVWNTAGYGNSCAIDLSYCYLIVLDMRHGNSYSSLLSHVNDTSKKCWMILFEVLYRRRISTSSVQSTSRGNIRMEDSTYFCISDMSKHEFWEKISRLNDDDGFPLCKRNFGDNNCQSVWPILTSFLNSMSMISISFGLRCRHCKAEFNVLQHFSGLQIPVDAFYAGHRYTDGVSMSQIIRDVFTSLLKTPLTGGMRRR